MGVDENYGYTERQNKIKGQTPSIKEIHAGKTNGTNTTFPSVDSPLYVVKPIPGRDLSCIATTKIPKGTRILSEAPLLTIPAAAEDFKAVERSMLQELKGFSKEQQHSFFSLHNAHVGKCSPVIGITKTNSIPFGSGGAQGGVFPRAARINHSCRQNSQNAWNRNLDKLTIHAIRDIEEGEEITIAYIDGFELSHTREANLKEAFGFECQCEVCAVSAEEVKQRDRRLETIAQIDNTLGNGRRIMSKPLECLHDAHKVFRMLNDEGITGSRISRIYNDALQITIAHGDQARAKVFAQRAYDWRLVLEGEDSPETMRLKRIIDNPASHGLYDAEMSWAQPVEATPQGLSETDFEKWLWREEEK